MEKVFGEDLPDGLWCAAFVRGILNKAGVKLPSWYKNCNSNSCSEVKAAAGSNAFTDYTKARPGDLIIFNSSRGEARHIGFVESIKDGVVTTIEGNSTDARVCRRQYDVNNISRINCYIRLTE